MVAHTVTRSLRGGAACIALAGILIPVSTLLRGPFVDPRADPAAFSAWVTSAKYLLAGALFIGGILFQIFGVLELYRVLATGRAPRVALAGTLLTVLTDALMLIGLGVFCFTLPEVGRMYREGHREAISLATHIGAQFIVFQAVQAVVLAAATVLSAIAIARAPALPGWSGVAYGVSALLIAFCPPLPFLVELPATALFGLTYAAIARSMWRVCGRRDRSRSSSA